MSCVFQHEVDHLVCVPPMPVSQLPTHCVCGEPFQYAEVVRFIQYDPLERYVTGCFNLSIQAYRGEEQLNGDELLEASADIVASIKETIHDPR